MIDLGRLFAFDVCVRNGDRFMLGGILDFSMSVLGNLGNIVVSKPKVGPVELYVLDSTTEHANVGAAFTECVTEQCQLLFGQQPRSCMFVTHLKRTVPASMAKIDHYRVGVGLGHYTKLLFTALVVTGFCPDLPGLRVFVHPHLFLYVRSLSASWTRFCFRY